MKLTRKLLGGLAIAVALATPSLGADKIKVALITKFPVPFFTTIEDAAKKYAEANNVDLVYCCGPLMRNLWDALSTGKRGGYAESSASLEAQVVAAIRAGDVIMVKGSLGTKMKPIVTALEKRFPGKAAHDEAAV